MEQGGAAKRARSEDETPDGVYAVAKPLGWTPLEAVAAFGRGRKSGLRRSYAGRLDPMAEGVLVVLEGERCAEQQQWQNHDKRYVWELLLGLSSDSYDVLGLGQLHAMPDEATVTEAMRVLSCETVGRRLQPYPPFSSARVQGHPLFWWALQGRLAEVEVPSIPVDVFSCDVGVVRWIPAAHVLDDVLRRVALVSGSFRQAETCARWRELLEGLPADHKFPVISITSRVSSGTYIRSLADQTGRRVGCGGLAWRIVRESVAGLSLRDACPLRPVDDDVFARVWSLLRSRGYLD